MTLEVKYKNRCDYSYISGDVLEIRDFNKKEVKYVLIKGSVALKDGEIVNGKLGTSVRR